MAMNWDFGVGDIIQGVGLVSDFFGEREKEKDRARVGEQQQRDSAKEREQIRSFAQDFETDFVSAAGGKAFQPGGQSAAKARTQMAENDYTNAIERGLLQKQGVPYQFRTPNDARAIIEADAAATKEATIDPLIDQLTKQNIRQFGGLNASNQQERALFDLQPYLKSLEQNIGQDTFALYNQDRQAAEASLANQLNLLAPQVSNVPYMANPISTGQGAGIAGLAQSPIPAPVSSVSNLAALSGVVSGGAADKRQELLLAELLRQIGDQPAPSVNPRTSSQKPRVIS